MESAQVQHCAGCGHPVQTNPFVAVGGSVWHVKCFTEEHKQAYDERSWVMTYSPQKEARTSYGPGIRIVDGFTSRNQDK